MTIISFYNLDERESLRYLPAAFFIIPSSREFAKCSFSLRAIVRCILLGGESAG